MTGVQTCALPILDTVPLKQAASADEVANVGVFLASGEADYITGQTMYIDGGDSA